MIELKNDIIKEYQVDDYNNYIVYIKEDNESYKAWLQNKHYGVMSLMFGLAKEHLSLEDFIKIVNNNIEREIKLYQELHEDEYEEEENDNI